MMSTIMSGVYFFIGKAIAEALIFFGFLALLFVFFALVESFQSKKKKRK